MRERGRICGTLRYLAKIKKSMTLSSIQLPFCPLNYCKSSAPNGQLGTISSIEDLELNWSQMLQQATKSDYPLN